MLGFYVDLRLKFQEGSCPDRLGLLALRFGIPQGFGLPQGFFLPVGDFDSEPERGVWGFGGLWRRGEPEL